MVQMEKVSTKEDQRNFFRLRRNGADGNPDGQPGGESPGNGTHSGGRTRCFPRSLNSLRENDLKEN